MNTKQKDDSSRAYHIDSEAFLKKANELISLLFQKSARKDEAEFIPACLYFTGTLTYSNEFDTFKSLSEFHDQMYDLVQAIELPGDLKIRLMMMYYCHIIETSSIYDFIFNLANIANGKPNEVTPFIQKSYSSRQMIDELSLICSEQNDEKKLKKFNSLTKKLIPVSIAQKIQMIQSVLTAIDLVELGILLEELHNKKIRNAFSHNSYNVYGENIQLFSGDSFERLPIPNFIKLYMDTVNFYASLAQQASDIKRGLTDGSKHQYEGSFGKFSVQFIKEGDSSMGRFNIESTKKTGSI